MKIQLKKICRAPECSGHIPAELPFIYCEIHRYLEESVEEMHAPFKSLRAHLLDVYREAYFHFCLRHPEFIERELEAWKKRRL